MQSSNTIYPKAILYPYQIIVDYDKSGRVLPLTQIRNINVRAIKWIF